MLRLLTQAYAPIWRQYFALAVGEGHVFEDGFAVIERVSPCAAPAGCIKGLGFRV